MKSSHYSRMANDNRSDRVVDSIYDAAVGEKRWADVLAEIAALVAGKTALLHEFDPITRRERVIASLGFQHANIVDYETHYYARDLWRLAVKDKLPITTATVVTGLVPAKVWEDSEIWNDYVRSDLGSFYCLGAKIPMPGDGLVGIGIQRFRDAPDFRRRDARYLQTILPHLRRALILSRSLGAADGVRLRALEALDALALGVVIVDHECRVLHANAAGENCLAGEDGLRRDVSGRLTASIHEETRRLHQMVAEAAPRAVCQPSSAGGALGLTRATPLRPLAVMVSPLPNGRIPILSSRPMALLFISDPDRNGCSSADVLITLYDLTLAEARLAAAIANGTSIDDYADQAGITKETARSHLKRALAKTDCHRQSDLVRLILTGPVGTIRAADQP